MRGITGPTEPNEFVDCRAFLSLSWLIHNVKFLRGDRN